MNHTLAMRLVQRVGDLDRVAQQLIERDRAPFQPRGERLALEVLHHQIVDAFLMANVVQRADVGVVEAGDGAGLALETLAQVGAAGDFRRQDLDGDGAIQPSVPATVDLAHPTGADRGEDLVRA